MYIIKRIINNINRINYVPRHNNILLSVNNNYDPHKLLKFHKIDLEIFKMKSKSLFWISSHTIQIFENHINKSI